MSPPRNGTETPTLFAGAGSGHGGFLQIRLGGDTCSWVPVVGHHASNFALTKA